MNSDETIRKNEISVVFKEKGRATLRVDNKLIEKEVRYVPP